MSPPEGSGFGPATSIGTYSSTGAAAAGAALTTADSVDVPRASTGLNVRWNEGPTDAEGPGRVPCGGTVAADATGSVAFSTGKAGALDDPGLDGTTTANEAACEALAAGAPEGEILLPPRRRVR